MTPRDGSAADLPAATALAAASFDLDPEEAAELPRLLWAEDEGTTRVRLVVERDGEPAGVLLGSLQGDDAFLDLVVVAPDARGAGIGRALLTEWERRALDAGATRSRVGENLHTYAWPGVDIRYTGFLAQLLRAGYARTRIAYNMDVPLDQDHAPTPAALERLTAAGLAVRRGAPGDADAVAEHTQRLWSESSDVWFRETQTALHRERPPIFLALRGERVVGFAAHGIHRPSFYGPIATDPAEQGHGIGAVLSDLCLADMAARGVRVAQIGWVAETAIPFYSRTAGARLGRCFWMLDKPLLPAERTTA
jgi:GNAT superfamily N-acetyltransferase